MNEKTLGDIVRSNYADRVKIDNEVEALRATAPEYIRSQLSGVLLGVKAKASNIENERNQEAFLQFCAVQLEPKEFKSPPNSDEEFRKDFEKACDREIDAELARVRSISAVADNFWKRIFKYLDDE